MQDGEITTRKLGLAAYLKIQGARFLGVTVDRKFKFATDRSPMDWETEYMNTDCYRHDVEVMNLRRLMNHGSG